MALSTDKWRLSREQILTALAASLGVPLWLYEGPAHAELRPVRRGN
jgi:hypothetical protein